MGLVAGLLLLAEGVSGIKWKAPAAWKTQAQRPMRAATYTVPQITGDPEPGEVAVFYFGPGQGGGVQANIDRWEGQFPQKTGAPKTAKSSTAGYTVTSIDVSGTYASSASPMSPEKINKPNFRMLGAIVEAPQGAVFFKFTGPAKTVAANEAAFQGMIKTITKE
ncbi:MAG: hypothetical protein HYX27_23655 [Acidobacteria bacterium]|nr:hypothetical protein [Acidobacteriota bacterium]